MLFSTKKASVVLLPESMIEEIKKNSLSGEEKETLLDLGFLVNDAAEERDEMLGFIDELNALNTAFSAIVVMNLDCNLACRYCFEGSRKGRFYMTRETANLFIDFIKNNMIPNKEEIKVTFYGGEPLLSKDLIIYITEKLKCLTEDKGIKYTASLITNGTLLTPDVANRLKLYGVGNASVTLDGPKDIHDRYRPFKSGKGTFDIIINNLKGVCDLINVQIGGNFTKDNYSKFPFLLDYLMVHGLTPDRISYVKFDPVFKENEGIMPPDFHDGCESINEPWLFDAVIYLRREILKRGYSTQKIMPSTCMMEIKDSIVLNYDGSIYKCPGLIDRKGFRVGSLNTELEEYRLSHNLDNWKNEECLNCSYLPLCFGGCRYMKLLRDGDIHGVDCKRQYLDAALKELIYQDIGSK